MKNISLKCLGTLCPVLVSFLATNFAGSLSAQDSNPLLTVRIVHVIPGKVAEFVDLQRQHTEARKKAGLPGRSIWQEVRGNTHTFHIVTTAENYADYGTQSDPPMSEADWATWISRITAVTQSRELVTVQLYPELEIKGKEGAEPNLLMLIERTVGYGESDAYLEWLTDKFIPYLRKNGETGWSVGKVVLGGNTNNWTLARQISSWAQYDEEGAFAGLSDKEREALFEGSKDVGGELSNVVLSYRADLSYESP